MTGERRHVTVSVVIPVRNRPELLRRAVASVLRQTRPVDEILIVDDASSDATPAVARDLAARDGRVRVLAQEGQGGACRARNRAIAEATSSHIAFLDSDDEWESVKIEAQIAALAEDPMPIAVFTGARHVRNGATLDVRLPPASVEKDDLDEANILGSTSCALVSRDALMEAGLFDPAMASCQDWDLYLRLAPLGRLAAIREPLTIYDDGDHGRISRNLPAVLAGHRAIAQKILDRQDDDRAIRRLRTLHAFKEADLTVVLGREPLRGLRLGGRAFASEPGLREASLLARLALRAARVRLGLR